MELAGKTVLVSGGANGIGEALVARLSREDVALGIFDVDATALDALGRKYPGVYCAQCDIGNSAQVHAEVQRFAATRKTIDVVVNCAALVANAPLATLGASGFVRHDVELWDRVIRVDLNGAFYLSSSVVEIMLARRTRGVVVNISSVAAAGNAGQSAYSAAKAGINAMTAAWAEELSPMRLRFVAIAPGFVNTQTTVQSVDPATLKNWVKDTPLKRLGKPEEIVDAILFAIQNDFLNGKVLEIDGGLRI